MQSKLNRLKQNPAPASKKSPATEPSKEKRAMDSKWNWKLVAPKAGGPTTKTFQGKEYIH
jgi:hypothetical protein